MTVGKRSINYICIQGGIGINPWIISSMNPCLPLCRASSSMLSFSSARTSSGERMFSFSISRNRSFFSSSFRKSKDEKQRGEFGYWLRLCVYVTYELFSKNNWCFTSKVCKFRMFNWPPHIYVMWESIESIAE